MLFVLILVGVIAWLWYRGQAAPSQQFLPVNQGGSLSSSSTSTNPAALQQMAQAIFNFEGGGKPGATNSWNNNPGNIGGGQATFATQQDGWNALYSYIQKHASQHPNWTFLNFFSYYLNGDPTASQTTNQGSPENYASYVANFLGVTPQTTVSSTLGMG